MSRSLKQNNCEAEGYVKPRWLAVLCYRSTATYQLDVKYGHSHCDIKPKKEPADWFHGRQHFKLADSRKKIRIEDCIFGRVGSDETENFAQN